MNGDPARIDTTVAVVLAAGVSRRFGPDDKRTARLANGQRLLAASVAGADRVFERVCVVLREDDIPASLGLSPGVSIIRAPHAGQGMGASLGDAIGVIQQDPAMATIIAVAILLGDMPDISPGVLRDLGRQARRERIIRPVLVGPGHGVRPGHPVIFGRDFWTELAALDGEQGAREVILRHPQACREVRVEDPGIYRDVDTLQCLAETDSAPPGKR